MITGHMRIACWIPKAKNTHYECVQRIAFLLQYWLYERFRLWLAFILWARPVYRPGKTPFSIVQGDGWTLEPVWTLQRREVCCSENDPSQELL